MTHEDSHASPFVSKLLTTPIKGFALNEPERVAVDWNGAVGDRDFFLVDEANELFSITRSGRFASWRAQFDEGSSRLTLASSDGSTFEDEVVAGEEAVFDFWGSRDVRGLRVGGPWSEWLSSIAGQPLSLIRASDPGGGYDEAPVTLLAEESVQELAHANGADAIDARRFRMLINIVGVRPYDEETWHSRTVRIGSVVLKMAGPVPRCNATTRTPDSGKRDLKTLALIAEARGMQPNDDGEGLNMGVYAQVVHPGVISLEDTLEFE